MKLFDIHTQEEMTDFRAYLERVLPSTKAQKMLNEASVYAAQAGDFESVGMIARFTDLPVDLRSIEEAYVLSIAKWLFQEGNGRPLAGNN